VASVARSSVSRASARALLGALGLGALRASGLSGGVLSRPLGFAGGGLNVACGLGSDALGGGRGVGGVGAGALFGGLEPGGGGLLGCFGLVRPWWPIDKSPTARSAAGRKTAGRVINFWPVGVVR
jgi:hypothetical protein